jgi:hypothetical protein
MTKKKVVRTKKHKESSSKSTINQKLVQNFIELQKINVDMAEKFDNLTHQISELLALFEMAARNFAKHPAVSASEKDKEFLDKIDKLLEQNKVIAKGLTLMEDRIKEKVYGTSDHSEGPELSRTMVGDSRSIPPPGNRPLPRF